MPILLAPREWLKVAIRVRAFAIHVDDPGTKRMMEELADECERIAQGVGELMELLGDSAYHIW